MNRKFKTGDKVYTIAGDRFQNHQQGFKGGYGGTIVGFSKWAQYPAAKILKPDGSIRLFLIKNLKLEV